MGSMETLASVSTGFEFQLKMKKLSLDSAAQRLEPASTAGNERTRSISLDCAGLVVPRKLVNPCMESLVVRQLNREIRWTSRSGISVLSSKSELDIALDKHKKVQEEKEKRRQKGVKNEFQQKLTEISGRLNQTQIDEETMDLSKTNKNLADLAAQLKSVKDESEKSETKVKSESAALGDRKLKESVAKENRPESELEIVFNQLRNGQKFR